MKKIVSFVLVLFTVFGLFANPLEKLHSEWKEVESEFGIKHVNEEGVSVLWYSTPYTRFVIIEDNELSLSYLNADDYAKVKNVEFQILHNEIPDVEWSEIKDLKPTGRKLVKRNIAKADAEDTATGKREGVFTAASRASEAKEDFEWSEE